MADILMDGESSDQLTTILIENGRSADHNESSSDDHDAHPYWWADLKANCGLIMSYTALGLLFKFVELVFTLDDPILVSCLIVSYIALLATGSYLIFSFHRDGCLVAIYYFLLASFIFLGLLMLLYGPEVVDNINNNIYIVIYKLLYTGIMVVFVCSVARVTIYMGLLVISTIWYETYYGILNKDI